MDDVSGVSPSTGSGSVPQTPTTPPTSSGAVADVASPWALPAQPPGCQICGCVPARDVSLHQSIGMLFLRRRKTVRAHVCRDCGVALFRKVQSATLLTGWWGIISFFANFGAVWSNIAERRRLQDLDAPRPPAARTAQTRRTTPLPIGRPTYLRPQSLGVVGAAIAVVVLLGLWTPGSSSAGPLHVGVCATVDAQQGRRVDCSDPAAEERIVAILPATARPADCPSTANAASRSEANEVVCWEPA